MKNYVNACIKCNKNKSRVRTQAPLKLTSSSDYAFQKIYIDIVGKLPQSGDFNYLLTVKDDLSGYVIAIPIEETDSETITRSLVERVFTIFGIAEIVISDNANNLNSKLMTQLYKLLKTRKINVTVYHPQGNSVERFHKDLGPYLRNFVDNKYPWADLIQYATFSHNTAPNESLGGFSPFEIVFGRKSHVNINKNVTYTYDDYVSQLKFILNKTNEIAKESKRIMKENNKLRKDKDARSLSLCSGGLVFIDNIKTGVGQKLQCLRNGPYKVIKNLNEQNVVIQIANKEKVVHKNLLTKYMIPN